MYMCDLLQLPNSPQAIVPNPFLYLLKHNVGLSGRFRWVRWVFWKNNYEPPPPSALEIARLNGVKPSLHQKS